jgi:diguanylate cyclase (GGDEF)-like protein
MMPDIGGYEVCHWLKANELTQGIPVIFATAQNDPAEEAQGLDEGAVDFISKPFHARVVLARVRTHITLKAQSEQLRMLATLDGLTGIANRRQFDTLMAREWRQCARSGLPLAVILLDIDFFKRYNDHCGHQAGDACIQAVASVLGSRFHRPHDLVARYGGEEFVCLLPGTSLAGASQKAMELERAVRELGISHPTSEVAPVITISLGVAVAASVKGSDPAPLIAAADRLLYRAKQAGRGQAHCEELSL